ncbi:MAG: phosphodiester glycosidase family protein [Oscillospiraceae bacterium]|nr:phosphodiester glycosidase family protein [Oscillospiraceae bacterium]
MNETRQHTHRRHAAPESKYYEPHRRQSAPPSLYALLTPLLIVLSVLALRWLVLSVQSDVVLQQQGEAPAVGMQLRNRTAKAEVMGGLDVFAYNAASDALSDLVYIKKIYKIPENDLVAPMPNPEKFGVTSDPAEVQAVVESAAALIDGRELIWSPDIERMEDSTMRYYCDDTILAVTWKEGIDGSAVTFAEIIIADGSQLRRALSGNAFGSSVRMKATEMATAANAVIAINGDFYDNRQIGLSVYQRQICRNKGTALDSCFFTASGDMLMTHHGELVSDEDVEKFIKENDAIFAVSFGPILVEDGQLQTINSYAVGEVDSTYSRAAIAQKGQLHYLLMTIGQEGRYAKRCNINEAAKIIFAKGIDKAYALDGGQTATMVMQGQTVNRVDWDEERTMSDIIYFATALPGGEVKP